MTLFRPVLALALLSTWCTLGCPTAGSSGTGAREDSRGVISGRVLLSSVPGAGDLTRVRVDLGRGEGGVAPEADGSFTLSDLEPDVYNVTITYQGGLEDSAQGSAYQPYSARVVTRAGSSVSLGQVALQLGVGSVTGVFTRSDMLPNTGMSVRLLGGRSALEATVGSDGAFVLPDVPVGRYQLLAERPGVGGVCGRSVVVGAHQQTVTLNPETLPVTSLSLSPAQASQVHRVDGNRWFLTGASVDVAAVAPAAAMARAWVGETPGPYATFNGSFSLTGIVENVETTASIQVMDACGQESAISRLTLVQDTEPPSVAVTLNGGARFTNTATMLLRVEGSDTLSEPLFIQLSRCEAAVCVPASPDDAPIQVVELLSAVTFSSAQGPKSVEVNIRDSSNNVVRVRSGDVNLVSILDTLPPANVRVTVVGDAGDGGPSVVYRRIVQLKISAEDQNPDGMLVQHGLSPTFFGTPWVPYVAGGEYTQDLQVTQGSVTVYVRLRDSAGNQTETIPVPLVVDNSGAISGLVTFRTDPGAQGGATVVLLGTQFSATTGTSNTFLLDGVPAGTYALEARAPGYESARVQVSVTPPDTTPVPEIQLQPVSGRVGGRVVLAGESSYAAVTVRMSVADDPQTPSDETVSAETITDASGLFSFRAKPGTYQATFETEVRRYARGFLTANLVVLEDQTFNVGEIQMAATHNDFFGLVQVEGETAAPLIEVTVSGEVGTPTESESRTLSTDANGTWAARDLPLGRYRIRYRRLDATGSPDPEIETVVLLRTLDQGPPQQVELVELRKRFVIINNKATHTNSTNVTLTISRPADCAQIQVATNPSFTGSTPEACVTTRMVTLPATDGLKTVYVRFYSVGAPTVASNAVEDSIILDTQARITACGSSPNSTAPNSPLRVGDTVTFTATAEAGGTMTVSVPTYFTGLAMRNDGQGGDVTANDNIYTLRYVLDVPRDITSTVTFSFRDAAGNAVSVSTNGMTTPGIPASPPNDCGPLRNFRVAVPPLITQVRMEPNPTTRQVTISWETDENTTGEVQYGTDPGMLTQVQTSGGSARRSHSVLLTTLAGAPFSSSVAYPFRIQATDTAGNPSVSQVRYFSLRPSTPVQVAAIPGQGKVWVRWEVPYVVNLQGFHIERSNLEEGPYVRLTATPYRHEVNLYQDSAVTDDVAYFYRVLTVDGFGIESEPSEVRSATPGGNTGPTMVGGQFIKGVNNPTGVYVWSARGSPYIVTDNIRTEPDTLLVIGPGTEVRFQNTAPGTSDNQKRLMEIQGRIAVLGARGTLAPDGMGNMVEGDDGLVEFRSDEDNPPTDRFYRGIQLSASPSPPPGAIVMDRDVGTYLGGTVVHRARFRHGGGRRNGAYGPFRGETPATVAGSATYMSRSIFLENWAGPVAQDERVVMRDLQLQTFDTPLYMDARYGLAERLRVTTTENNRAFFSSQCNGQLPARTFSCRVLVQDSTFNGPYLEIQEAVRAFDIEVRNGTNATGVIQGSGSIAQSLLENNVAHTAGVVAHSNLMKGATSRSVSSGRVLGNDLVDNGCVTATVGGTNCAYFDISANDEIVANRITHPTAARFRNASLVASGPSSRVLYNHLEVSAAQRLGAATVLAQNQSALINRNSFLATLLPGDILLSSESLNYSAVDTLDARFNAWGPAPTLEMQAIPRGPIAVIRDLFDNPADMEVTYTGFVNNAYPLPRITSPWWHQRFYVGDPVVLTATATDPETGVLDPMAMPSPFRWQTTGGAPLGSGATVTLTDLQPGVYDVEVIVTDPAGLEARLRVEFEVWPAP